MNIWLAISLILLVAAIYMFAIELFSVAFKLTGLATSKIKFQVASLFTSTGFTTEESELITNDERRRKIAVACAYTGHIFSVVIMGLIINVFVSLGAGNVTESKKWYFIAFFVCLGLFALTIFLKIPPINKRFQKLLESIAIKSSSRRNNANIITVLDYYGKSAIVQVVLNKLPDFANEVTLNQMALTKKYAMILLSLRRGSRRVSINKDTMLVKGDIVVCYGHINDIRDAFINSVAGRKDKTVVVDNSNEIQVLNNYGANTLMEVVVNEVPKELEGIPMKDSHLVDRYSIQIIIIKRDNEYLFVDKDMVVQKGDTVTLFGPYVNIKHLFQNAEK